MIRSLTYLIEDPDTKVIVLISKPPHPESAEKIFDILHGCEKPVVVYFLGRDLPKPNVQCVFLASTLEHAANMAVSLSRDETPGDASSYDNLRPLAQEMQNKLGKQQRYVRGLFSGGTHNEEAILILGDMISPIHANVSFGGSILMDDVRISTGHSLVDIGDEYFTLGKPHPIVDPSVICERLIQEANDPQTAVLLFDILLGYGANADPVGIIGPTLEKINNRLKAQGRQICMIVAINGTDKDPQGLKNQIAQFEALGVKVMTSTSGAATLAGLIVSGLRGDE
jgi:hypothetical protein